MYHSELLEGVFKCRFPMIIMFDKKPRRNDAERERIVAALNEANWIVSGPKGAAALLGVKRSTLQSRMQKLGIHILRRGA